MELKVLCDCGQKFKFDVEPVNGRLPVRVNCPSCNADVTAKAETLIAESQAAIAPASVAAPPPIAPAAGGLRLHRSEPAAATPPPLPSAPAPIYPDAAPSLAQVADQSKGSGEYNMGLGILGAVLGAGVGAGAMYGFFFFTNFRFPLMGTLIGLATGLGARMLYKGTDSTLGGISAAIAVIATCGTLFLMYGELGGLFIISIGVSGYFAYRVAG